MRFLMLPAAQRWPCRLEARCTTPAVAVVIAGKDHIPTCLFHLVELAEACQPGTLPPPHPARRIVDAPHLVS